MVVPVNAAEPLPNRKPDRVVAPEPPSKTPRVDELIKPEPFELETTKLLPVKEVTPVPPKFIATVDVVVNADAPLPNTIPVRVVAPVPPSKTSKVEVPTIVAPLEEE